MKHLVIILFGIVILNSCELLQTRNAEKPVSQRSDFIVATTPQQLFKNLQDAFREKILRNYEVCFVDTSFLKKKYVFIPSAGSIVKYNILSDWDIDAEKQYFTNLISKVKEKDAIVLNLFNEENTSQGDSAQYVFDYKISFPVDDPNIPNEYEGSAQFTINLDANNQWVITKWQDFKKENFPSWSELKGRFYLF